MLPTRQIFRQSNGWKCRACRSRYNSAPIPQSRSFATKQSRKSLQKLPRSPARTRFAPSPTGYLHLGSLRTALFNYLLAKATGGQFLLRIEDTDKKRTVPGAAQRIFDDLRWAGLQWDEGPEVEGPHGPYYQSQRGEIYSKYAAELLKSGHAYRCFCSVERLDELARARAELGLPTDYDRSCLSVSEEEAAERACKGESHTIRLKVPDVYPGYQDIAYGEVGTPSQKKMIYGEPSYEDPVLVKSDGQPTYHLANVVDDHLMQITHVIRGVEWMPSTFKHIAMYDAFGWQPPQFAHVGLLQDKSGKKLSKRDMDIDIDSFRKKGIFPETLLNHVALLGWSHNEPSDFLPLDRLIEIFNMKFTKGNTIVNFPKMAYLQKLYSQKFINTPETDTDMFRDKLQGMTDAVVLVMERREESIADLYVPSGVNVRSEQPLDLRSYIAEVIKADASQYESATEFYKRNRYFFNALENSVRKPVPEDIAYWATCDISSSLELVEGKDWEHERLKSAMESVARVLMSSEDTHHVEIVKGNTMTNGIHENRTIDRLTRSLSRYLRWALMDSRPGPPIATTMELLGRTESLKRIEQAQKLVSTRTSSRLSDPETAEAAAAAA